MEGLTDRVRAAIATNPRRAYEVVLGRPLMDKPGARELVGRCELHDDHSPSLRVNLEKRAWYCDPCGRGGDVFDLAGAMWGTDFPATRERLADLLGVDRANGHHANGNGKREPKQVGETIRYEIRDLAGELKAVHVRIDHDDGSKAMPWDPEGVKPQLLPLFQIEKTIESPDGAPVIFTEGEKPAKKLWEVHHVLAVGTVTGARGTPCDESLKPLLRFKVYLWPDNDEIGCGHMQRIGRRLVELRHADVWQVEWPDAPEHGDAADFTGDLPALIEQASRFEGPVAGGPWAEAQTIDEFLAHDDPDAVWLIPEEIAREYVTVYASPRGLGKTHIAYERAISLARRGLRVMLIDRDNPKPEIKRRLRAWGGAGLGAKIRIIARDKAPPLTDKAAWAAFPYASYDLVVLDSISAATEGVEEKDGGKAGAGLAPLLDAARKGPAVLLLANTDKAGLKVRGSGILSDRADIIFEIRDATDLKVEAKHQAWWDALPECGEQAWADRAKRRRRRDVYRLALVSSKFRGGEEPNPRAIEIHHDTTPWRATEVTAEVEQALEDAKRLAADAEQAKADAAVAALVAKLPIAKNTDAINVLVASPHGFSRNAARRLIGDRMGRDWVQAGTGTKTEPFYLISAAGRNGTVDHTETATSDDSVLAGHSGSHRQEWVFQTTTAPGGSETKDSCRLDSEIADRERLV